MRHCECEKSIMDVEHDAGCRRCGLPVCFVGPATSDDGHTLTIPQRLTIAELHAREIELTHDLVGMSIACYGDGNTNEDAGVLVVFNVPSPADNPVVALMQYGNAHAVRGEADYLRWLEILRDNRTDAERATPLFSNIVAIRADDETFIVRPGGSYSREVFSNES
jgi:hypothetical protein